MTGAERLRGGGEMRRPPGAGVAGTRAACLLLALVAGCGPAGEPPGGASGQGAGGDPAGRAAPATEIPGPELPDTVRAAVEAELRRYYAAFSARDWARFRDHFWPGATLTTVWRPSGEDAARVVVTSLDDFVERAPEGPGSAEIFEERMVDVRTRGRGGLVQAWVRYEARFGDPGSVQEWRGVDAFTLMRHDGRWRIVSLAYAAE